jgi:uncharacterized protein YpiB (UPF0302 family)
MGNKDSKYNKVPLDDTLENFNEIKTKDDAIIWVKTHFAKNEVTMNVIHILQTPDCTLIDKSYKYENSESNDIMIYFRLRDKLYRREIGTSICYTPQLKS